MVIVFNAKIDQIHCVDERVNFTPICAWVRSKTCGRCGAGRDVQV
ncbi:transcriptional regulator [Citrobacter amalonaticus]|uniref:Transcriptional regulator n=1 Tax=Citrobacter amalonaticus TaxID=35703 RepID=A0A2S4S4H4_CITAM|nr:transcriptional regulator [Citrobacter amalonaticus]POT78349.1 transcriptional regulator [Citrobacter amalonaticus]POU68739.1 transcriptional regulator [Citrobacter amalonaticus]POV08344.1 transcriptional regulator [Citrobacter amalonaticus]